MKKLFTLLMLLSLGVFTLGMVGCDQPETPAEQAADEIEETTDEAGDEVEEAGDELEEAVDEAGA